MTQAASVTAALLVIGDEILSGRTRTRTSAILPITSPRSASICAKSASFQMSTSEIVAAVNALRARYDYLFTTGGIGPTHDDITADAVAGRFWRRNLGRPARDQIFARDASTPAKSQ